MPVDFTFLNWLYLIMEHPEPAERRKRPANADIPDDFEALAESDFVERVQPLPPEPRPESETLNCPPSGCVVPVPAPRPIVLSLADIHPPVATVLPVWPPDSSVVAERQ
jgi:hypothetical protein